MVRYCSLFFAVVFSGVLICGCTTSSPTPPAKPQTPAADSSAAVSESTKSVDSPSPNSAVNLAPIPTTSTAPVASGSPTHSRPGYWEDYPDVPKIEIMTEVDGIKIPRMPLKNESLKLAGPIPADVGNEHAKSKPSQPTTGDTLTIRFNAEPKVLNVNTESSAVMNYIMQYVGGMLARQNNETFEYEPEIAKNWVVEDSVKLSADYPGRERRVSMNHGPAQSTLEFDYVIPHAESGKPAQGPSIQFTTTEDSGEPLGHVWVGIYPIGKVSGAPSTGYHNWSNDKGELEVSAIPAGRYQVKTGDEIFGISQLQEDGSLLVSAGTKENPLREPLTLKAGQWLDVQAKTYTTFYLREDAKWSDGVPFTTKDIEFGYALLNSPSVDGDAIRTYYSDLVECTALGPHSVRLRFRQQYFKAPEFSYEISYHSPPFHFFEAIFRSQGRELTLEKLTPEEELARKQISASGQEFGKFFNTDERYNSKPLGTGPYIVDKWERKDRVELVRNPNYWIPTKAGHVDRIIVKFIPDQVTAFTALKAGLIDFLYDMSPEQYFEDWPTLDQETQQTYVKSAWFSPTFSYLGWNQLASPLKDRRVRMALTMLFDRQDFINKKLHGEAVVVSGTQFYFGLGYDREVPPIAYDPETARELLAEAGWIDTDNDGILDRNGERFQITLKMPKGKPINEIMCEIIQKNFKDVGIELTIQTMEWASFIEKLRSKECDAIALRWVTPIESDPFQIWHSSEAAREKRGSNAISFKNSVADELIEMLRVTLDENKRHRIHQSFHRLIDSEQPYTFLWIPKEFGAYHKRFRNVKWYRLRPGFDLTEWYVPEEEQLHK